MLSTPPTEERIDCDAAMRQLYGRRRRSRTPFERLDLPSAPQRLALLAALVNGRAWSYMAHAWAGSEHERTRTEERAVGLDSGSLAAAGRSGPAASRSRGSGVKQLAPARRPPRSRLRPAPRTAAMRAPRARARARHGDAHRAAQGW